MKDPIILRRHDLLSPSRASYWKDLLYRVTKVGTEIEAAPPKGCPRESFEQRVADRLAPSGSYETLGPNGVLDVSPEHCGIEVRIIGRHPHFRALHEQYRSILAVLAEEGARVRPTCGLHFHVVAPSLAEPLPEIVLANLWNVVRRYSPELRFLTSGGDSRAALCRRRNHTSHLEMVRHSPAAMHMTEIQAELRASRTVPEHQNFINLEHIGFTQGGQIHPFHLEFRFPDSDLCPSSVTAKVFLFLALVMKAVDLSQYGVIHVGKVAPWRRKIELLGMLSNNDGNLATSDTRRVTDEVIEELRQGCFELLDLLGPAFERFPDGGSLEVLTALAERPISLLRCAGYDWQGIEALLAARVVDTEVGVDEIDRRLMQRIELSEWAGMPSPESWQWHAARELYLTPQDLERRLTKLDSIRGVRWDPRRGTMVFGS